MSQKATAAVRDKKYGAQAGQKRTFFNFLMMPTCRKNPVTTRVYGGCFSALAYDHDELFIDETTKL